MENLFSSLLQQSLTACWVIPAVLALRFLLRKAPKRITNLLWLVVAFRLICPLTFESDISLVAQARTVSRAAAELVDEFRDLPASEGLTTVTLPEPSVTAPVPAIPEGAVPAPGDPAEITVTVAPSVTEPSITVTDYRALFYSAGSALWLAGMAVMALYGGFATRQWHKRVRTAVRGDDGIWRCETVETPFILGVLRPRIYLPFQLPRDTETYVIAHEQAHLRRHDPLLKCLAFGLLTVYWFHPLVWVSYFLFFRDMELACDQRVTRNMDAEGKKAYSRALLACTVVRADPVLCPLSFGEVGIKARIQAVLRKRPSKAFAFTALILCTLLILCCAADPKRTEGAPAPEPEVEVEAEPIPPTVEDEPVVQETALYSTVIGELITQYGCFYAAEKTPDLILGLKYAHLHDLGGDDTPELITLVNTRDSDLRLTMTLRVYGIGDGQTVLLYETPLGGGYRQTDVSYRFAFTEGSMHNQIITYHTSDEWYEEVLHVAWFYSVSPPDVHVYRALSTDEDEELEQFWEDDREITGNDYRKAIGTVTAGATEIDACWDTAPAGRAEMEAFLQEMGLESALMGQAVATEDTSPDFSVAEGMLYYQKRAYRLPNYRDWHASGSYAQQVGKHLLISAHINPDHSYYAIFNTETLTFDNSFWGLVLDWREEDLTTLIYCQWKKLYTYDDLFLESFAEDVNPNVLLVEGGHYSLDGSTFTVTYSDDALLTRSETFPVPEREILEAANLLNGQTIWRTGLQFCRIAYSLTGEESQTLAAELLRQYGTCTEWPFECAQIMHTASGSVQLTLLQPHEESKRCLAHTFYLEPDGTILRAEDTITDGYSGTLVYENDSCALIASRRVEGCLRGGEPCGYCFVTDLRLWNAERTESILLLEGAELAINFTVLDTPGKTGILSIAYSTGLSHSEYDTRVFADIDLAAGTYTETSRVYLSA